MSYILRDEVAVPAEASDPLVGNEYFGTSGSLLGELTERLEHGDSLYSSDNKTVYMAIATACAGTSVESTIKTFNRTQNGRGAFMALMDHHAGDTKYCSIAKKRQNLLSNIKWNEQNYSLEKHVSNHRQAVEDLHDCGNHITVSIPDASQRVEFLIDSISCGNTTLQAAIGLIRSNVNNMHSDFESTANSLIEVDPFSCNHHTRTRPNAQVAGIDFSTGCGRTGVDLQWYPPKDFKTLINEQRDELIAWQKTSERQAALTKSKQEKDKSSKRKENPSAENDKEVHNKQKKWLSSYIKKPAGLKHVMYVLAKEESGNSAFIATLSLLFPPPQPVVQSTLHTSMVALPPPPTPAVSAARALPQPVPPVPQQQQLGPTAASSAIVRSFPGSATQVTLNSIFKFLKQDGLKR